MKVNLVKYLSTRRRGLGRVLASLIQQVFVELLQSALAALGRLSDHFLYFPSQVDGLEPLAFPHFLLNSLQTSDFGLGFSLEFPPKRPGPQNMALLPLGETWPLEGASSLRRSGLAFGRSPGLG